jgi:hypothetical protein
MPGTVLGLLLLLAAAAPGFVYTGQVERRVTRRPRSDFRELAETVLVGSATTIMALLLVLALGLTLGLVTDENWAAFVRDPSLYLATRPQDAAGVLLLGLTVLLLSAAFSWVLANFQYAMRPRLVNQNASALHVALSEDPRRLDAYCTVELDDGRRLMGYVGPVSLQGDGPEHQQIVLRGSNKIGASEKRGLYHQARLDPSRAMLQADYAVLRGDSWRLLYINYVPRSRRPARSRLAAGIRRVRTSRSRLDLGSGGDN